MSFGPVQWNLSGPFSLGGYTSAHKTRRRVLASSTPPRYPLQPTAMKKIAVFTKPSDNRPEPLIALVDLLTKSGFEVLLDERAGVMLNRPGHTRSALGALCDAAVVLGGDGTMLGVARDIAPFHLPMIGVNAGRLGFITDIVLDEMEQTLPAVLNGECTRDKRPLLAGAVIRGGKEVYRQLAVNDLGISHGRAGGMVDFVIYVNGRQMSSQSADGIICSSPTGSTAYSLAAGGPILHPSLNGIILVPVAPHTLSNRPIVLPADMTIDIELTDARDAVAYFDMQEFFDVVPGDVLRVTLSGLSVEMLHPLSYDYYKLLRRKLQWNYVPKSGVEHDADA